MRLIIVLLLLFLFLPGCDRFGQATPLPTVISPLPTSKSLLNPPTPVPPSPSPPPTSPPLPTPTYDASLDDWTILVYMSADNTQELPGLLALNEMEAAGSSERVNVIVQIDRAQGETDRDGDWSDTRRYRILGDDDRNLLNSEPLQSLGEQNMGDPAVLADFIGWGVQRFPANRYALILWGHGAGWQGTAFDEDAPNFEGSDHISLPDLAGALAQGLTAANLPVLELIGFDASLVAQLDAFQTVQPFARYAVASESLMPAAGWDYEALLRHLFASPAVDGRSLAGQIVADFLAFYTAVQPDDLVTLAAVDLSQLGGLTQAVERLGGALAIEPGFVAEAVANARSEAASFAPVLPGHFDQYAAVDLHQFAALLAQHSPDEGVVATANAVMAAVEAAVVANGPGAGQATSRGVAIYFPPNGRVYSEAYSQTTQLTAWDGFLRGHHAEIQAELPPPQVNLSSAQAPAVGWQNPAFINLQVIGRQVESVGLMAGRYLEDGRRLLLANHFLPPAPAPLLDGGWSSQWRNGVHDAIYLWDTEATFLFDSLDSGDFVLAWPAEPGSTLVTVPGRFRRADSDFYVNANLVFDDQTASLIRVWTATPQLGALAELLPQTGDEFQAFAYYLVEGELQIEAGTSFFFDDSGQLYFERRPLADGRYFFGLQAENAAGDTAVAAVDLTIDNSIITPGYKAYLDPTLGFQFLYPEAWQPPRYQDAVLSASQMGGSTQFQLTIFPEADRAVTAASLKAQTLQQFGAVDILFENEILVAGQPGLRTVYGYNRPGEGERTGIFLTFIQEDSGYVVDVDGLASDEATTQAVIATIAASWTGRDVSLGLQPGRWPTADLAAFTVAQPATFAYQRVGSWEWFGAGATTFVALRTQPTAGDTLNVVTSLAFDAGADVVDFSLGSPYSFPLADAVWQRVDFGYDDPEAGPVRGFLMARVEAGQDIVAWAEAPAESYERLETAVFLTMIADLALR